jgi:hypothetical protein
MKIGGCQNWSFKKPFPYAPAPQVLDPARLRIKPEYHPCF